MKYSWEKLGENRDASHVLSVNGDRVAVAWLQAGFVERPDSWRLKIKGHHDTTGHATLEDAKRSAEQEFV